ncbi:MAG: hypothetical protein V3S14_02425 [Anaerolineae bacterium]
MTVHKFGGTLVGNAERFASVAGIIIEHHHKSNGATSGDAVVVVSAMSGVTKQLIAGARAAAEGKDTVYREIKAGLLSRHLEVVETLLNRTYLACSAYPPYTGVLNLFAPRMTNHHIRPQTGQNTPIGRTDNFFPDMGDSPNRRAVLRDDKSARG